MNTAAVLKNATCCQAPSLRAQLADLWRAVFKDMFGPYRPEKHYMRGPGPKWLERHANQLIYSQSLPSTKAAGLTDQDGTR